MTWIKICGITSHEDAYHAVRFGADAIGFNFFHNSPRYLAPALAEEISRNLPAHILRVGVFVNEVDAVVREIYEACGLNLLQFHGDEGVSYCKRFTGHFFKVFGVTNEQELNEIPPYLKYAGSNPLFMLDTRLVQQFGGTGETFDWALAVKAKSLGNLILSGGLKPANIGAALGQVKPYGVDVSSGLEAEPKRNPGKKDPSLLRAFIEAVRKFDHEAGEGDA